MPYNSSPNAKFFWSLLLLLFCQLSLGSENGSSSTTFPPTIQIVILVHPYNKALYLPYLLRSLEAQIYPKDRLRLHLLTESIFYKESYFESVGAGARAYLDCNDARFKVLDERIRANDESIEMLQR